MSAQNKPLDQELVAEIQAACAEIKRDQELLSLHLLYQSQGYALAIEALRVIAVNTGAVHAPLIATEALQGCDKLAALAEAATL